jgi:NADH-quinone oxidoreductase subunit B
MELSGPTIVTPTPELIAMQTGKAGPAVDPFFTNVKSELSDKGFLVATADNLIAWREQARSCGCNSDLPVARSR